MNDETRGGTDNRPDIDDFERTVSLKSPLISAGEDDDAGDTLRFDDLDALLSDEPNKESPRPDTPDTSIEASSEEDVYNLDIQSGELHELDAFKVQEETADTEATLVLNDIPSEESAPEMIVDAASANEHEQDSEPHKVELTEADYIPPETASDEKEEELPATAIETEGEPAIDTASEEEVAPPEAIPEPSSTSSDEAPAPEPEAPATPPRPADTAPPPPANETSVSPTATPPKQPTPRTSALPLMLAILALGAGGGAWWQSWQINSQLEQLAQRLSALEHRAARPNAPDTDIKALNERITQLSAQLEKHLKTVAMNTSSGETTRLAATAPATADSPEPTTTAKAAITPATPANTSRISHPNRKAIGGTPPSSGPWVVNLVSFASPSAARAEIARLKRMGIAAETVQVRAGGKTWQRVRVAGFASRASAEQARRKLARKLGIGDTWVSRR